MLENHRPPIAKLPSLRYPVVPIGDGFGRFFVHADAFDLRKGNSHRAIPPFGLDHHFSEAVSFVVVQHSEHGHPLTGFQRGYLAGFHAFGFEGESQCILQIAIPARPDFTFVVCVHDDFHRDAFLTIVVALGPPSIHSRTEMQE